MWHTIKYIFISISILALSIFFYSNHEDFIQLKFGVPYVGTWQSIPLSQNLVIIAGFCLGIIWAGFLGAFRFGPSRELKRNTRKLESQVKDLQRKLDDKSMEFSSYQNRNMMSQISPSLPQAVSPSQTEEQSLDEEDSSKKNITHLPPLK